MAVKENEEDQETLGPSVILGLVGAVVVLLLLGAGIWGVGKIISKIKESREENAEEEVAEEVDESEDESTDTSEEGDVDGDGATDELEEDSEESNEEGEDEETTEDETSSEDEDADEGGNGGIVEAIWVANNYQSGDINGDTYTVVWGDTLWEIAEAKYGSGFEWGKVKDANLEKIGTLPNGSKALIYPGQILNLP